MDQTRHRKEELSRQLDSQRHSLTHAHSRVTKELNLTTQLKRSVKENPWEWFAGSFGTATIITLLFRRRPIKTPSRRKGILRWTVGTAFGLAKPFLLKWAVEKSQQHLPQMIETVQRQKRPFR